MGLDWCLSDKPKPGHEEEFGAAKERYNAADDGTPEYEEAERAYVAIASSPSETLGVPQIGIDQAATDHFLNEIVPSHREAAAQKPADDKYRQHWEQSDEALVADAHGNYAVDLVDEYKNISTITAYGPFRAMAGSFSFRGKVVQYSPLLEGCDDVLNETHNDMSPPQMADYAGRIEQAAIGTAREQHGGIDLLVGSAPSQLAVAAILRDWAEHVRETRDERAKAAGQVEGMFGGWTKPDTDGFKDEDGFAFTDDEEMAERLLTILDAARWLRFWADLGHPMHAWY